MSHSILSPPHARISFHCKVLCLGSISTLSMPHFIAGTNFQSGFVGRRRGRLDEGNRSHGSMAGWLQFSRSPSLSPTYWTRHIKHALRSAYRSPCTVQGTWLRLRLGCRDPTSAAGLEARFGERPIPLDTEMGISLCPASESRRLIGGSEARARSMAFDGPRCHALPAILPRRINPCSSTQVSHA